ncbi:LytR/AlgR family response regulator transcription factor [Dyadobacter psychrotolerans]|uniref:Response regulator transcription factor n=1 Tax=Dyadobacter psychrotolerans TaxID=2541721 RepID=A0A4R5DHZ5_9BACT|nr:LytTR family DNA-binding domain-containing protein [Dyadobacter psychrotolerans]TDE11560.1 response regulator transcription factor [Dyadobacter psychrotolerans]
MNINCLIVDDEPIARDIIKTYCGHLPYLHIVAASGNALEAKIILHQQKVDILFLDINMPVMDGVTFLKTLRNPPQVIFTTAYKEYALDAFDLAACDYLLKPFSLERFIVAVDKAIERLQITPGAPVENPEQKIEDFIFIKTDGKIFKIRHEDLLYAEASGNYTKIVTTQNTLLPAMTFSSFEELLPKTFFLRVHRSFIISKSKIDHIEGNRLFISKTEIPIGNNYRESFLKELGLM